MSVDVELDSNIIISGNSEINSEIDIEMSTNQEIEVYIEPREYKVVGDDVYIPINFDSAPTWLTQAITDLTNIKVTDVVTNLDSMINDLTYAVQQIEVAKNQYEQSITSLNDIDSRFNSLLTTLNSNMGGLDASLKDLIATKVTSTQASVVALNTITTAMNDTSTGSTLGSAILNLQTSITNLNNSTNTSLVSLESSINGAVDANAQAVEVINTYVGIDDAGASTNTGLSAYLEDSAGNIGGADSSVANSVYVDSLGNTRSKFEYNSNISYNGYNYQSGFGIATNLTSSSIPVGQSEFWINASKFKFTNTNKTGQVAPFTIDASGVTPQITFNGKVTFSNVTNTTGTGSNLLYNSAPKIGSETKGWYVWTNSGMTVNLSAGWNEWKPTGGASVAANIGGNPSIGSVYDVGPSLKFPVIAGSRYEASAYISAHRSNSYVCLLFYDTSGNYIVEAQGNVINYAGSNALVNWGRSSVFTTAPGSAATALLIIRSTVTGSSPYCFVTNAFAGVAEANQTTPSNWSEGTSAGATYTSELSNDAGYVLPAGVANAINTNTTTINGSKITTGSITAAQIQANSVSADRLMAGTNGSTVWTGGGLVSSNFNGNPVGVIGSPTRGFRLSSNSEGNSSDPNIYGAYIRGSTIAASALAVDSLKIETAVNTFAPLSFASAASVQNQLTSDYSIYLDTIFSPVYSGGYYNKRVSSYQTPINLFMNCFIDVGDVTCLFEVNYNDGGWRTVDTRTQNGNGNSGFAWSTVYVPEASWSYLRIRFRFVGSYMRSVSCNYLVINGS